MDVVKVHINDSCSYPVYIGVSISNIHSILSVLQATCERVLIVTHPKLLDLFQIEKLVKKFQTTEVFIATIPEGEAHKNIRTLAYLYEQCHYAHLDRYSAILAIGGGVIGDVAGFVSATYLRGLRYLLHVPTTLLAMVDSSIGGKNGIDTQESKNSIGSFRQPSIVWIDPQCLQHLPQSEFNSGLAEIIKIAIIGDPELFSILENEAYIMANSSCLPTIIKRAIRIKAKIVSADEKENKLRMVLNLGHTFAHAIESETQYKDYKHGEAVAIGMCAAGYVALKLQFWSQDKQNRMESVISKYGLPTRLRSAVSSKKLLHRMHADKKVKCGRIALIIPKDIGKVSIQYVEDDFVLNVLPYIGSSE